MFSHQNLWKTLLKSGIPLFPCRNPRSFPTVFKHAVENSLKTFILEYMKSFGERLCTPKFFCCITEKRILLDYYINKMATVSPSKIEARVRGALRLGLYQLMFMDRIPAHAAVNESVSLVPRRISGFVNALLRRYLREGDKIAVGVSAGKDSLALLCALADLRRFYPKKFELCAITVDMGFEGADFSAIKALCDELDVPYTVVPTQISKIIFDVRKEKNPCSLCAKMRRGALHTAAKELGCNTVALGHHFDDVVETFMLNLFFEGRLGCFQPVTYLSRMDIRLIRPMIYMPEKDVRYFAKSASLPVMKSPCPADGNTEREEMKQLLAKLDRENKGLRYRIFGAIQKGEIDGFKPTGRMQGIKNYELPDSEE